MALWGINTGLANTPGFNAGAGEAKPTWQINWDPVDAKGRANNINHNRQTFANTAGWEEEITYTDSNGNSRSRKELLVAVGSGVFQSAGLPTDIGKPTITDVSFASDQITGTATSSNNIIVKVTFNEKVYVGGTLDSDFNVLGGGSAGLDKYAMHCIYIGNGSPGAVAGGEGNVSNACYYGVGNGTCTLEFSMASSRRGSVHGATTTGDYQGGGGTGELSIIGTHIMSGGGDKHSVPIITSVREPATPKSNLANTWFSPDGNGVGYRSGTRYNTWNKPTSSAGHVAGDVGGGATIGANVTVLAVA